MTDFAPGIDTAFSQDRSEGQYRVDEIEGQIPEFVQGTCYWNGPAGFDAYGLRYRNWLDGDGMVSALQFSDGDVCFTNRFVRSRKLIEEAQQHRPLYRTFGTAFPGDRLRRGLATESPVNVSVFGYAGKLLAFGEQSLPMELDPIDLTTLGPFDFDGQLNEISPFSAHPKIDHHTHELLNFGISFSATQPCVNFYRFDAAGKLACRSRTRIDYPCSIHDFSVSARFASIYLSPYVLDISGLMRNQLATVDALSWHPHLGSQLLILAREDGRQLAKLPIGERYCLHVINSFEVANRLFVDVIEYDSPIYDQYQGVPDLFETVPWGRPVRYEIDVDDWRVRGTQTIDYSCAPDFPAVRRSEAGAPYDDFWVLGISTTGQTGRKFFDALVHANWSKDGAIDAYHTGPGQFLAGEPVFVSEAADSRAGVVICPAFDANREQSRVLIFDSRDVARGPLATLTLKKVVRLAFHADFVAATRSNAAAIASNRS